MRRSRLTISYVVYPPNYQPGDGYKEVDTLKKAVRNAPGSSISRCIEIRHSGKRLSMGSFSCQEFGDIVAQGKQLRYRRR